jgi:hypothetical protein
VRTWWVKWLKKGMDPCSTSAVVGYFYEELQPNGVDSLHKVLANKEATGSEVRAAAYPSIRQWVVLGVAIWVTDWSFLALTPFCLKSTMPSWQVAMSTTVLKLLIQFSFKHRANFVKKHPNQEIHLRFVVVSKKIMLNMMPTYM